MSDGRKNSTFGTQIVWYDLRQQSIGPGVGNIGNLNSKVPTALKEKSNEDLTVTQGNLWQEHAFVHAPPGPGSATKILYQLDIFTSFKFPDKHFSLSML